MAPNLTHNTAYKRLTTIYLIFFAQFILLDQCFADAEVAPCQYANVGTLPVTYQGTRAHIQGTINNNPVTMLVDTGAEGTSVTEEGAKKLKLPFQNLGHAVIGLGGAATQYTAGINQLSAGPIHIGEASIGVVPHKKSSYDAILGASSLFRRDMEINSKEKTIKFYVPSETCSKAFLAYWDQNASTAPLIANRLIRFDVMVEVNGKKILALIDTGAAASIIDLKTAARLLNTTPTSPGVVDFHKFYGVGEHVATSWVAPFESFTLGEETIKNVKIVISNLNAGAEADGYGDVNEKSLHMILGADFLKAHRILFAVSQEKLYFSYLGGDVFQKELKPKVVESTKPL